VTEAEARRRFAAGRVAVLGTVTPSGSPHLVPVTFVVDGDTGWTATDAKPKGSRRLQRHANIAAHPRASLLVQHWSEDWTELWWVRADGAAEVRDDDPALERVTGLLRAKYGQYADVAITGPVIAVQIDTWRWWTAR
jgi:PPOX class probable F420-dependent enzyme